MESLSDSERQNLHQMSSERIQGRLMRAGMNEDRVYTMDRPELLEAMANVMQNASVAAAAVSDPNPHRRRKVSKSVWAMASAVARAYNGVWGQSPQRGPRGQSPRWGARGRSPLKLKPF